jgi:hypothetical protein
VKLIGIGEVEQRGVFRGQMFEVAGLVIGDVIDPAFPEDTDPFEGQSADDGLVAFAAFFLLSVESGGPGGIADGLVGPLDESLAEEPGSVPTPVDPFALAAFLGDGGDATEPLKIGGQREAVVLGAESDEQARGQCGAGAGEVAEQVGLGMIGKGLLNLEVIEFDALGQFLKLSGQEAAGHGADRDDGLVGGQGFGVGDALEAVLDGVGATNIVGVKEGAYRVGPSGFEGDQVGPFEEKGAGQGAEEIFADQIESLWIIGFEESGQGIGELSAQVDGGAAGLNQTVQFAGLDVVGMPGGELVAMDPEQIQQEVGIGQVVFGAGGIEGLAITGAGFGIDRIEGDEFNLHEGVNDRGVFGFQGDRDGAASEAGAQSVDPVLEGFSRMREGGFFDGGETLDLEGEGVSLIAPIQADKSSVVSHNDSSFAFLVLESAQSV